MFGILRIEGDPTSWNLRTPVEARQLTESSGPVPLEVLEPLAGRLLLSPRSVGSAVLLSQLPYQGGHAPNGIRLPEACLYVPSTTGPDPHSNPPRYYLLPGSVDRAALEAEITAAMSRGTFLPVDVTGPAGTGVVVLNGGALPFVVLCPASPGS